MRNTSTIATIAALVCATALAGCKKADTVPTPRTGDIATPSAATPAPSPASDPSLPDAARVLASPASPASPASSASTP
jgi:hypothetical protein